MVLWTSIGYLGSLSQDLLHRIFSKCVFLNLLSPLSLTLPSNTLRSSKKLENFPRGCGVIEFLCPWIFVSKCRIKKAAVECRQSQKIETLGNEIKVKKSRDWSHLVATATLKFVVTSIVGRQKGLSSFLVNGLFAFTESLNPGVNLNYSLKINTFSRIHLN